MHARVCFVWALFFGVDSRIVSLRDGSSDMMAVPSIPQRAEPPSTGDKILVLKPESLALILCGAKTHEVRGACYRAGKYYLGCRGHIFAQVNLGRGIKVENTREWLRYQHLHQVYRDSLPYKKTYIFPIHSLNKIRMRYHHPRGAISIVKYVRPS